MGRKRVIPLASLEETLLLGSALAKALKPGTILALHGDLGAGKTSLVQGIARGLHINEPIQSPTFVYLNLYQGTLPLYHFDLYRLPHPDDFLGLGFDEYFDAEGICAIEWPEKIHSLLPAVAVGIHLVHTSIGREIHFDTSSLEKNLLESLENIWP